MLRLTFHKCYGPLEDRDALTTRMRRRKGESDYELASRAAKKFFGRRAFFHVDSGLPGYGQIFRNERDPGGALWSANSVTDRVRLDIEENPR